MRIGMFLTAVTAAGLVGAASPAAAVITTFAQYQQQNAAAKLIRYERVGSGAGTANRIFSTATASATVPGAAAVNFQYAVPGPAALSGNLSAFLTFDATTTSRLAATGTTRTQTGFNGFLQFTLATPVNGLTNLLRLDFTNAQLATRQGATQLSFGASTAGGSSITATSDFLTFNNIQALDFSISVVALNPSFAGGNNTFGRTVRGSSTGIFSSDPAPFFVVPEPQSWALMVTGFGLVAGSLRRRRATAAA